MSQALFDVIKRHLRKLALHGVGLEAGQLILSDYFTRPVAAHPGDTFHVDYGPLGSISNRFV